MASSRNALTISLALLALALFSVVVYVVVSISGGVGVSPDYSNTPNAVVPGPPAFK